MERNLQLRARGLALQHLPFGQGLALPSVFLLLCPRTGLQPSTKEPVLLQTYFVQAKNSQLEVLGDCLFLGAGSINLVALPTHYFQ